MGVLWKKNYPPVRGFYSGLLEASRILEVRSVLSLLEGSSDFVTRVTNEASILIVTYSPIKVITLFTKSDDPPSRYQEVR